MPASSASGTAPARSSATSSCAACCARSGREAGAPMTRTSLRRLLQPRSIAFIGGRHAELALRQSRAIGYDGAVWPVNPKRESLSGVPCYPSIAALPEAPDAALVAVPAAPSVEVVRELSEAGAGGAVCFATGFARSEERRVGKECRSRG